jgi:hypothetical protein
LQKTAKLIRFQAIDPEGVRILGPEQGSFTRLPRTPEKESGGSGRGETQGTLEHQPQIIMII